MPQHATKKEVDLAINELHEAMIESIEASKTEQDAKIKKMKAHHRLSLARDAIRELTFNN